MTALTMSTTGAASTCEADWDRVNWDNVTRYVHRLQMRIAKARRENRQGKVKSLQWLLTHSFYAKLLAVKQVTQNRGRKTAGVDNITWQTPKQKMQAAQSLQRRGYKAKPLRRIYIPKKNGKLRPLGIPTMKDRAMQALHLLALEPVAESTADKNSYGFRPKRSTADAIERCFALLSRKSSAQWILEADIKSCFDCIDHRWLLQHIPMDKTTLKQWLSAGYMEKQSLMPTREGTPQGGIISPTLANMALDGLEKSILKMCKSSDKTHVVRYADDFIITGSSREFLENKIKPAVEAFLKRRGLVLSQEKTKITHISEGFNFLGFNIRKYKNGKLLIKPAKENVLSFLQDIRETIKRNGATSTERLISQLNPKLRGWAYYYRHVVSKQTFSMIDSCIYDALSRWIKRRHPKKNRTWCKQKYFRSKGLRNWVFSTKTRKTSGQSDHLDLFYMGYLAIVRHRKIKQDANPYDPAYKEYFEERALLKKKCSPHHWIKFTELRLTKTKLWDPY